MKRVESFCSEFLLKASVNVMTEVMTDVMTDVLVT